MRNLLGRLNARSSDDLVRIARFWRIPLPGTDRGRHVGMLYRVMTDLRASRDAWALLDDDQRAIIALFANSDTGPQAIPEIAAHLEQKEPAIREAATALFQRGILAVQGDNQELPVGERPRLFLPRELAQDMRRIIDEIEAGNQAATPLRTLLEGRDDAELEESASRWGIRVIPGLRRRNELVEDILHQASARQRIDEVIQALSAPARALCTIVHRAAANGPVPFAEAVATAGMTVPDAPPHEAIAKGAALRSALTELEISLLVLHTYMEDGSRALFVPQEILHPGTVRATLPLRPLQPIDADSIPAPPTIHPFAVPWDVLTVVREIISRGAPVWVPGEPLSLTWQRQLNRRLWFGREDIPPDGYLGMLLYLALGVGVLEPGPRPHGAGADKHAVRPVPASTVRQWRSKSFADQVAALRDSWFGADGWIEGRERDQVDVWGADWQGFRRRLLGAFRDFDTDTWYQVHDVARRIAEEEPNIIGSTFTAASARSSGDRANARTAVIAQIIEVEIETAFWWFGFVELSSARRHGRVMRVTGTAQLAARDLRAVPDAPVADRNAPVLSVDGEGQVTLHHPAPLHIWSLSAFGDAERLSPEAVYQVRPGSVGRALGAGFDLEQIIAYLERQGGTPLPESLTRLLREWTAGYKRVRMRRAAVLAPDFDTGIASLREALTTAGLEVRDGAGEGEIIVLLPATGEDAASAEETLQATLRAAGYAGQWTMSTPT